MRPFFIYFSLFTALFLVSLDANAQDYPTCNPSAQYMTADTAEWIPAGESISGSAPIQAKFFANPENTTGWTEYYEWNFKQGEGESQKVLATRYEQDTDYEFTDHNSVFVTFYALFTQGNDTIIYGPEQVTTVTAYESQLEFPNAFSPHNGDDYNDVYKAKKYKSILEFHAYIFNRWGQKLYEWSDPDGGWDGTYNGKDVKEGVYYVLVKAKGADGRKFTIKKDVNLLRGYHENGTTSSTTN